MGYKPIITKISAFDATIGTTITFGWKGAQAFQNELIIRDSETLDIVYKYKTGRDMSLKHVMNIEEGTTNEDVTGEFVNGKQYQATITLSYNRNGATSGSTAAQTGTRYWNSTGNYSNPSFTLRANGFARTNYTFQKWAQGSASGTQYNAGATITLNWHLLN